MTGCNSCGKPLELAKNDGDEHDMCREEYHRRLREKKCVYCGDKPADADRYECKSCKSSGAGPQNYPGPQ